MKGRVVTAKDIGRALAPVLERGGAKRAILFGSYARGKANRFSDIDLLIIAESTRPFVERFKDFPGLWRVSPVKALDVFVYTEAEFQRMQGEGNPFVAEAMADGITIYEAGAKRRGRAMAAPSRE